MKEMERIFIKHNFLQVCCRNLFFSGICGMRNGLSSSNFTCTIFFYFADKNEKSIKQFDYEIYQKNEGRFVAN